MKPLTITINIIHLFVGMGALAGGYLGMSDPTLASMGANSAEMLRNAPFDTFFIPGLFLFVIIGIGNIASAVSGFRNWKFQGYPSGIMGGILMAWIVIQCFMLMEINILHIVFFIIGSIQGLLALVLSFKQNLFPVQYIKNFLSKSGASKKEY